jgi:Uma2 family endonuclease
MGTATAPYRDAIDHLPDGATLTFQGVSWVEYERLLQELTNRPRLRVSYDAGRLEITSPLPEHEEYARFIDAFVRVCAERDRLHVQSYGGATWKRSALAKGAEPDACYYVASAVRVIGKRRLDLDVDPPPDIVVEIDITNESLAKFGIYTALGVPEVWRYDGNTVSFYTLDAASLDAKERVGTRNKVAASMAERDDIAAGPRRSFAGYREVTNSRSFSGLTPRILADALEHSKSNGQTAALEWFRAGWNRTQR